MIILYWPCWSLRMGWGGLLFCYELLKNNRKLSEFYSKVVKYRLDNGYIHIGHCWVLFIFNITHFYHESHTYIFLFYIILNKKCIWLNAPPVHVVVITLLQTIQPAIVNNTDVWDRTVQENENGRKVGKNEIIIRCSHLPHYIIRVLHWVRPSDMQRIII